MSWTHPRDCPRMGTVPNARDKWSDLGTVPLRGQSLVLPFLTARTVPIGTVLAAALLLATPLSAQDGPPPPLANVQLENPDQEARALALMENLRCIQCQGQSIHDSDAPIAAAMRHEVRTRISAGQSEAEINRWLIERYGDWVSFAPPSHGAGLILWLAPLLLLGAAFWLARGRFGKGRA
jgi:cytochrome c-type biogenesis protein CcmH